MCLCVELGAGFRGNGAKWGLFCAIRINIFTCIYTKYINS